MWRRSKSSAEPILSAEQFVTPLVIETISENPVYTSMWKARAESEGTTMNHIDLARWADVILVAPATANTIAQLANGFAGNLLTTEILAAHAPIFVAPAMNPTMYAHPATRANVQKLELMDTPFLVQNMAFLPAETKVLAA